MVAAGPFSNLAERIERLAMNGQGHNSDENTQRTLGEILATLRALDRRQEDTSRSVDRAVEALTRDMSAMKHEARNAQQITQGKLEILQNEHQSFKQRLETMEQQVTSLQKPVQEMVNLRRHMGAMGMLVLSVGTVVWAVLAPVWTAFAERFFGIIRGG
jgi:hypothetical protein